MRGRAQKKTGGAKDRAAGMLAIAKSILFRRIPTLLVVFFASRDVLHLLGLFRHFFRHFFRGDGILCRCITFFLAAGQADGRSGENQNKNKFFHSFFVWFGFEVTAWTK